MQRLINNIKMAAILAGREYSNPVIGLVDSYDPDNYAVKIKIAEANPDFADEPEVISGWMPLSTIWAGNGWGLFCPPSIGDQVEVDFQEGDFEAGHCDWRFFNNSNRPVHAESGVFYIIHQSGTCLKFENDGSVKLANKGKEFMKIEDGKISLSSGSEVDLGDVTRSLHKLVTDTFVLLFNTHTHQVMGVKGGPDVVTSQKPQQPMSDLHLTEIVKGN